MYAHQEEISEHTPPLNVYLFIYKPYAYATQALRFSSRAPEECPAHPLGHSTPLWSPLVQRMFLESSSPPFFPSFLPPQVPITHFPFSICTFPTCASPSSEVHLAGTRAFGSASGERLHPIFIPSLWLCHCPNSVLILLASMNTKTRFVACCLHCWGVQTGAGCDCLAGTEVQADMGAGRAGVSPFKLLPGVCGVLSSGTVINEQG